MHGLINKSFEGFLRGIYGQDLWRGVMEELDLGFENFESMFHYDDEITHRMIDIGAERLGKPREVLLEDFGTFLVADPRSERVRRLLRFGGVDYADFLQSLGELHGRVRLAISDLDFPHLILTDDGDGDYSLACIGGQNGFGFIVLGVLRALADDYGALAFLEHLGRAGRCETISIRLLDKGFFEGRDFSLAQKVG